MGWPKRCVATVAIYWLVSPCAVAEPPPAAAGRAATGQARWTIPVLVLRYFPVTADKQRIDIAVTSNVRAPLDEIRKKCDQMTAEAASALEEGSRFRAYQDAKAPPSLKYVVVADGRRRGGRRTAALARATRNGQGRLRAPCAALVGRGHTGRPDGVEGGTGEPRRGAPRSLCLLATSASARATASTPRGSATLLDGVQSTWPRTD